MNKLLLMLMFISLIIFGNCNLLDRDDSSVIRWKGEDLSEYVLYAFPVDKVAIINLETGDVIKILDDFDEHIKSLITNKDGSTIYVSTADGPAGTNPGNIYRIDTETWIREVIYENAAYLLERKYDEIFFVSRTQAYHERVLGKINDHTGKVSIIDSLSVRWSLSDRRYVEFDSERPKLYAIDGDNRFYRYDYATSESDHLFDSFGSTFFPNMTLSFDGSRLFIAGGPVLDLNNERVVGSIPVWHLGTVAARRDMKEVYITDPAGYLKLYPLPSSKISVYSPEKDKIIGHVHINVDDPAAGGQFERMTDQIFLTDNERYAITNDWMSTYFVIDLKEREVVHFSTFVEDNVSTLSLQRIFLSKKPPGL